MEYIKPEVEIIIFDGLFDIITTSKLQDTEFGGSEGGNWGDWIEDAD